jgi:hypothetical protein
MRHPFFWGYVSSSRSYGEEGGIYEEMVGDKPNGNKNHRLGGRLKKAFDQSVDFLPLGALVGIRNH